MPIIDADAETEESINPREGYNLGKMVCFHRRYRLGDNCTLSLEDAQEIERTNKVDGEKAIVLPLYLYDHSGLAMNTTGYSCPWDSGRVGIIYATHSKIRECYGVKRVTKSVLDRAKKALETEVSDYNEYLH